MSNDPLLERINEFSRLAKLRPLTPAEEAERDQLRAEYLARFRESFRRQLEHTVVEYPDGSRVPLRDVHKL